MQTAFDLIIIGSGPPDDAPPFKLRNWIRGPGRREVPAGRRRFGAHRNHSQQNPARNVLNLSGWRERGFYGRTYKVKSDITADDLRHRLTQTLDHEVDVLEHQFTRNNVTRINGHARFLSREQIDGRTGAFGPFRSSAP